MFGLRQGRTIVCIMVAGMIGAACAPADEDASAGSDAVADVASTPQSDAAVEIACAPMIENMELEGRASPYDSTTIALGDEAAKLCYGRPSARGRTMIGGENVPYGELWRTGANEPTTIHLPVAAEIAGIAVEPGSYSIYTVPTEDEWTVIVNRSIDQWGHESRYTEEVRAQEVGRATVPSETMDEHVETMTFRAEPAGANAADLVLEWETTRVRIPVRATG